MKNLLSGAATFAVLLALAQGTVGAPVFEDHVLLTSGKGGYHTYRIPAAVCTAKGTVLFFCEARKSSTSDFGQTHLLLLTSSDRGRTWSDPRIVWKDDSEPNVTIGNPCPVLDVRTGTVWIGFTRNNQRAFVTKSTDEGRTWATPTEITEVVKPKNWKRCWFESSHPDHEKRQPEGCLFCARGRSQLLVLALSFSAAAATAGPPPPPPPPPPAEGSSVKTSVS